MPELDHLKRKVSSRPAKAGSPRNIQGWAEEGPVDEHREHSVHVSFIKLPQLFLKQF